MKICPVATELFHADRQTDMMKLTVTFCNFANAPKNAADFFSHLEKSLMKDGQCYGM
jgi:hypothetical protein